MTVTIKSRAEFREHLKQHRKRVLTRDHAAHVRCLSCRRGLAGRESVRWGDGYRCAEDCHGARLAIDAGRYAADARAMEQRRGAYTMSVEACVGGYRTTVVRNSTGETVARGRVHAQLGYEGMRHDSRMGWLGDCALKTLGQDSHSIMRVGAEVIYGDGGYEKIEFEAWARKGKQSYNGFSDEDVAELERRLEEAG